MSGPEDAPTVTLADFLLARIGEDEEWAQSVDFPSDPARALADCEARRRIVETPPEKPLEDPRWRGYHLGWRHMHDRALRSLALRYADHPDYREEWR